MSPTISNKSLLDLHPREIKEIVKEVPTLPVIYRELFEKMQDPNVAVPQIAEIITHDQALSAKILHLVNSAFYGYSKQIKTINRAVVILGFRAVRSAALATSVFDYFKDEQDASVNMLDFWKHSLAVASISKVLAGKLNLNQDEDAFIVGLLHDVGKLVEKRYFEDDFTELCQVAREQHLSWYGAERELFQVNHAGIGKAIFRAWNFPPAVVDAVQFHHNPGSSTKVPQLTALVHLADFMSYELGFGAPGAHPPAACSPDALRMLNTDLDGVRVHEPLFREELDAAMEILKLLD